MISLDAMRELFDYNYWARDRQLEACAALQTVPLVESNVKKLGFRMIDIRLLLASHAHYDHAGGMAAVKSRTKARLLMNPQEVDLFSRGGKGDFAFGDPDRALHARPYPGLHLLLDDGSRGRAALQRGLRVQLIGAGLPAQEQPEVSQHRRRLRDDIP